MDDVNGLNQALIECIKAAGGSKVVASLLWPQKELEQARRRLMDCLNDDRPDRLCPDQVLLIARIARQAGCHAYMAYCARHLHYDPPVPREPRDEAAELQRAFVLAVAQQQQILDRLQALAGSVAVGAPGTLKAVG